MRWSVDITALLLCGVCGCSYTSIPQDLSLQLFLITVFEPMFINLVIGCSCLFVFIQQGWPPPRPSSLQWHPNPRMAALPSPNHKKVSFTLTFPCAPPPVHPPPSSVHHALVSSFCHAAAMWSIVFIYLTLWRIEGSAAALVWFRLECVTRCHQTQFPKQILHSGNEVKG